MNEKLLAGTIKPNEINFVLANSADPDKMLPYAAFHLGIRCLP